MKSKHNTTNYLAKGFIMAIFAVTMMINSSAQKMQDVDNSVKFASSQIFASELSGDDSNKTVTTNPVKKTSTDVNLEEFLVKAAGLNKEILMPVEDRRNVQQNNFENFLLHAAGMNACQGSGTISTESDDESQSTDLTDFLVTAAGLDLYTVLKME